MHLNNDHGHEQETSRGVVPQSGTGKATFQPDSSLNIQGKIFYLPPKNQLPEGAMKRVRPKGGLIEDGVYNHPVVVISRPYNTDHLVHFHGVGALS
jgi:hypothetical protein